MENDSVEIELSKPAYQSLKDAAVGGGTDWVAVETEDTVIIFVNRKTAEYMERQAALVNKTPSEWLLWHAAVRWN